MKRNKFITIDCEATSVSFLDVFVVALHNNTRFPVLRSGVLCCT